jgi:iron(III) transport system substrate-binding protein
VKRPFRSSRALAAVLAIVCVAAAASAAFAASTTSSRPAQAVLAKLSQGAPRPATKAQWARIVAQAKQEGSVTLYTSQNPVFLADTAKAFKAKYGITLTVNRNIDSVLTQQISAEESSGKVNADVVVIASKPIVYGMQRSPNFWMVNEVGPDLYKKAYNREWFGGPLKANMVGEAILGIGWNTSLYPKTIKDLPGVLDASLKDGKLGVVQPSAPSLVDWYLWVMSRYGGKAFLQKLAAQKPKIYTSALPMTQAVVSGEITAGSFVATSAINLKEQGAPINFVVPGGRDKSWNAPYWGMVLKKAPHAAAAQLLMNYLVTKEGQATSQQHLGVVLKGIPGTFYIKPRTQNLLALTPEKVAAFQQYWKSLFQ